MKIEVEFGAQVPEGYELTGEFRVPNSKHKSEPFLTGCMTVLHTKQCDWYTHPRFILRKVQPEYQVFKKVSTENRPAVEGDWYQQDDGTMYYQDYARTLADYPIYKNITDKVRVTE